MTSRPSTHTIVNMVLGVVAAVLVSTAVYLEAADRRDAVSPTITTTTSTTTTSTTSTTTSTTSTTTTTTTSTTLPETTTTAKKKKPKKTTTTVAKKKKKKATTTTTTTVPPPPRGWVTVLVVNGTSQGGRLEPMADTIEGLGYPPVRGVAGAVQATDSKIYAASEDFRSAGERLATDIGMKKRDVELFDDAPPVSGLGNAILILYLGGS